MINRLNAMEMSVLCIFASLMEEVGERQYSGKICGNNKNPSRQENDYCHRSVRLVQKARETVERVGF